MTDQSEDETPQGLDAWVRSLDVEGILAANAAIAAVADFSVSSEEDEPFVEFINWLNTRPKFIAEWRSTPELEAKHYSRFMQGLEASRAGYAASRYHLSHVAEIENSMHTVLARLEFPDMGPGTTTAFGSTRKLHYEYQAFVMAYRRSLDGLAFGLSAYFKTQQTSFRKFAKDLLKYIRWPSATPCQAPALRTFRSSISSCQTSEVVRSGTELLIRKQCKAARSTSDDLELSYSAAARN